MGGRDPTVTLPHGQPAWTRVAAIGDYDGALDKEDCQTERTPYAWAWYQDYTAMLGTAFTVERASLVHAKKLALCRGEAARMRASERAICNALPATADELLGTWATILAVPYYPEDERWQVRLRCAARLQAPNGPNPQQVDESLARLLGDIYVTTHRARGATLSAPPTHTYWSENPGAPGLNLGGGTFMSERARVTVEVRLPGDVELGAFLRTVNVALFQHLDRILPAAVGFGWTSWFAVPGFYLDVSRLDLTGLTPS